MRATFALLLVTAAGHLLPPAATAAPIQPGSASYELLNVFTTRILPNDFGFPEGDFEVVSTGVFVTEWGLQVGDQIPFEITSSVTSGDFFGNPFQIFAGIDEVPLLGPFVGTYSNVVQDEFDPGFPTGDPSSLVSADVAIAGPFAQVFADGTTLYATDPYNFVGPITGLPYPIGTEFEGMDNDNIQVRLQLGPSPDPMVDPVIGLALDGGIVRVIPEPSSLTLILLWSCACCVGIRRSKR